MRRMPSLLAPATTDDPDVKKQKLSITEIIGIVIASLYTLVGLYVTVEVSQQFNYF